MSLHGPRRGRRVRVARESRARDRDRPVTDRDLRDLRRLLAEDREARAKEKPKPKRGVGRNADATAREYAERPKRPLTERQMDLLSLLTEEPESPSVLGEVMELNASQMGSVMSSLCARGLARKVPGQGWRLA